MANETPPGVSDADIDALLAEMKQTTAVADGAAAAGTPAPAAPGDAASGGAGRSAEDSSAIDALLASATFDDAGLGGASTAARNDPFAGPPGALPLDLPDLQRAMADAQASSIDLLRDVELNVKIELGRSKMLVEDV